MDKVNYPVRLFFKKEGRSIYISHLDLSRCLARGMVRSQLPIFYTQGFNPHLFIAFSLPLSLGVSGLRESCDIKMTQEMELSEIKDRLNAVLPKGIEILEACHGEMDANSIMWADYNLQLDCPPLELSKAINAIDSLEEIKVTKRTKKGMVEQNIKPLFYVLGVEESDNSSTLKLRCRAGVEINLNPALVLEALKIYGGFEASFARIVRTAILTENYEDFR